MPKRKVERLNPQVQPLLFLNDAPLQEPKLQYLALGLDFGSCCGYAYTYFDRGKSHIQSTVYVGQWDLSIGTWDSGPMRLVRMRQFLNILLPDIIFFEDVKYIPPAELVAQRRLAFRAVIARVATASELLGAFKTTAATWAEENSTPAVGFSITEIKKHGTGKGQANKVAMIRAANERFGTEYAISGAAGSETYAAGIDNEVDALFCLDLGMSRYSEGL